MKATARRTARTAFTHRIDIRQHQLLADEPTDAGGEDEGPRPQELLAAALLRVRRSRSRCTPSARAGTSARSRSSASTRRPSGAARRTSRLVFRLPNDCTRGAGREAAGDRRQVPRAPHARRRGHLLRAHRDGRARGHPWRDRSRRAKPGAHKPGPLSAGASPVDAEHVAGHVAVAQHRDRQVGDLLGPPDASHGHARPSSDGIPRQHRRLDEPGREHVDGDSVGRRAAARKCASPCSPAFDAA